MNDLITIFLSGGLSVLLASAVIFLGKSWITQRLKSAIQHEYDQKLETHKAQLKAQSDIEIEKLKSYLQIVRAEHNIKLSEVFKKQAEILQESYQKLGELNIARQMAIDETTESGRVIIQKYLGLSEKFRNYFYNNQLYLPDEVAFHVNSFLTKIEHWRLRFEHLSAIAMTNPLRTQEDDKAIGEVIQEVANLDGEISSIRVSIHHAFQELLGIKSTNQSPLEMP